jgi:hypothetical protein
MRLLAVIIARDMQKKKSREEELVILWRKIRNENISDSGMK